MAMRILKNIPAGGTMVLAIDGLNIYSIENNQKDGAHLVAHFNTRKEVDTLVDDLKMVDVKEEWLRNQIINQVNYCKDRG